MTPSEHLRNRAEELARDFKTIAGIAYEGSLSQRASNVYADAVAKVAYKDGMCVALPIIDRLLNTEHDQDCDSLTKFIATNPPQVPPCNCTLGQARQEGRKLTGR